MAECYDHLGNKFKSQEEMCNYYGLSKSTLQNRLKKGISLKDALTMGVIKSDDIVYDHLGNSYTNKREMVEHYGITFDNFKNRIKRGWTLEAALTTEEKKKEIIQDHLGNIFNTVYEMCEYYGLNRATFQNRIKAGMSLEDALTTETKKCNSKAYGKVCYDHLGNRFSSTVDMCRHYGVTHGAFMGRIKNGMPLEEALSIKHIRECTDHLGNTYSSIISMCDHYGISYKLFSERCRRGYSLKDALTKEVKAKNKGECFDHLGNRFDTRKQMCDQYNISAYTFDRRIKNGWTLKDALTLKSDSYYDTFGNKFNTMVAMCNYYGVDASRYSNRIRELHYEKGEGLGIRGRGLDAAIRNKEIINICISNIKFAYTGRNGKVYYTCTDKDTGEELLLNSDEILMYKQSDYRTAVEQLIKRRKEKLSCQSNV